MSTYDFIVIGAGSAGAALAYRLSENPQNKVLLLEAGRASYHWTRLPVGYAKMVSNPAVNWLYEGEPEEATNGRKLPMPRGKILGGSSSINGMAYVRGQAQDFDTWAQMGCRGWTYREVLPYFKRMESYDPSEGEDEFRGRDGPIRVKNPDYKANPLYSKLVEAAGQVGIHPNPDYNGASQDGIVMSQGNISPGGKRMSTAACYLEPARNRQNLHVETNAHAEKLLFEGRRCTGIRYAVGSDKREALAGREVIVSTGAINSPQLLELSGIGQADRLSELGIDVVQALPGVGENYRDHYAPRTRWLIGAKGYTYNDRTRGLGMAMQALRYALRMDSMLGMVAAPMRAFVRSREGLDAPDALLGMVPMLSEGSAKGPKLSRQSGVTVYAHVMRPESRGHIHIRSADPYAPPASVHNFLSSPLDVEVTLSAVRIARAIMTAPAMQPLQVTEVGPGTERQSDDELLEWVKATAETTYHPVGTCKMGPETDPTAVVDPALKVHGIEGLRVADASIMPTLTSGNTNAPSIMIGEKAADLVLGVSASA